MTGRSGSFFICFTGIDGSGKTTLARELVSYMNFEGIKCKYVYNRLTPILTRFFIGVGRLLFLRGQDMFGNYTEYSSAKRRMFKGPLSKVLSVYEALLLLDYCFQALIKVKLPLTFGQTIVCDRYVYDTIITDLAVDFNYSQRKIQFLLDRFFLFLPKPQLVFLMDLPEEIAYERKNDVPSIRYLKDRRPLYLNLAQEDSFRVLDCSEEIANLRDRIHNEVFYIVSADTCAKSR